MLAHPAMDVVFKLSETISLGNHWLTAGDIPKRKLMELAYKSVKVTSLIEILRVERDKPLKRETQIW